MADIAALPTHPDPNDLQSLEDEITELAAHIHAATYRFLVLIREFDEQSGWSGPGLKSCAHWLSWKYGIDLGAGRPPHPPLGRRRRNQVKQPRPAVPPSPPPGP